MIKSVNNYPVSQLFDIELAYARLSAMIEGQPCV